MLGVRSPAETAAVAACSLLLLLLLFLLPLLLLLQLLLRLVLLLLVLPVLVQLPRRLIFVQQDDAELSFRLELQSDTARCHQGGARASQRPAGMEARLWDVDDRALLPT
jgi:hypothetical protein